MMQFQDIYDGLVEPFPPEVVKHRQQAGRQLAYVDARDVADFLDVLLQKMDTIPNGETFFVGAADALATAPLAEGRGFAADQEKTNHKGRDQKPEQSDELHRSILHA